MLCSICIEDIKAGWLNGAKGSEAGCFLDPCACLGSSLLSTLEAGIENAPDKGTAVVEVPPFEGSSILSILSRGGGGVFNGSSISIGVSNTLLVKGEAFPFL